MRQKHMETKTKRKVTRERKERRKGGEGKGVRVDQGRDLGGVYFRYGSSTSCSGNRSLTCCVSYCSGGRLGVRSHRWSREKRGEER